MTKSPFQFDAKQNMPCDVAELSQELGNEFALIDVLLQVVVRQTSTLLPEANPTPCNALLELRKI